MKTYEIAEIIERYAPLSLALDFDNVGLLVGDRNKDISSVLLTLDIDGAVAKEAVERGAELIISHHPVMFNPIKKITADTPEGRCLMYLIENNISVYTAHTNLDAASGGLNDLIAVLLDVENTIPLTLDDSGEGIGRVGVLKTPLTLNELALKVKRVFNAKGIRFSGNPDEVITKVALSSGGGGSLVRDAIKSGAQVYISGDIKYDLARTAGAEGMNIIELLHYDSEIIAAQLLRRYCLMKLTGKLKYL